MEKVVSKIILVVGIIFLFISIATTLNRLVFLYRAQTTDGIVINLIKESLKNGGVTYRTEVRFSTKDGEIHVFQSNVSSDPPAYKIGSKVKVLYIEKEIERAVIDSFFSLWFLQTVFLFLGFVFLVIAINYLRKLKKGDPISRNYNIEFTRRELLYFIFGKKICPHCQSKLERIKLIEEVGNGNNMIDFCYRCKNCSRSYNLNELSSER